VLLEVRGNAEAFNSIATSLPQILGCADSKLIHTLFQQRPFKLQPFSLESVRRLLRGLVAFNAFTDGLVC